MHIQFQFQLETHWPLISQSWKSETLCTIYSSFSDFQDENIWSSRLKKRASQILRIWAIMQLGSFSSENSVSGHIVKSTNIAEDKKLMETSQKFFVDKWTSSFLSVEGSSIFHQMARQAGIWVGGQMSDRCLGDWWEGGFSQMTGDRWPGEWHVAGDRWQVTGGKVGLARELLSRWAFHQVLWHVWTHLQSWAPWNFKWLEDPNCSGW